ncbi:MAG: methylmalonyl-CoA mutase family protein [Bacteroidota bacterium]
MANLFDKFQPVSKDEWLAKVERDLKGKSIDAFNWEITDGITLTPFAHADDLLQQYAPLANQRPTNSWEIGVKIRVGNPQLANKEALNSLMNGANAIAFELAQSPSKEDLAILLKDIELEWISTHFIFKQKSWKRFLTFFTDYVSTQGYDVEKLHCTFSFKGNVVANAKDAERMVTALQQLPNVKLVTIKAHHWMRGTDKVVQELAQTLAKGNTVLTEFHEHGLDLGQYHRQIQFSLAIGDSYFVNIAKLRALKLLWTQILTAWNINDGHCYIEAHLTESTQTDNENYNKIKATSQAMAAVIGGAQRLYIYPSDEFKDGLGTPFAQRIALNIQHLMQLESYLDRVVDPAAGSYYIENLTNELAEAAWIKFQNMEVGS